MPALFITKKNGAYVVHKQASEDQNIHGDLVINAYDIFFFTLGREYTERGIKSFLRNNEDEIILDESAQDISDHVRT